MKTPSGWRLLAASIAFTFLGLIGGWLAAPHTETSHSRSGDGAPADAHTELPPETLRNLGVEVSAVEPTSFVVYRSVPAVIVRTPSNEQPVVAAMGGRVREVLVEPGMVVAAGDTLLTLIREPIPRPLLDLTEEVLKPARESIHAAVIDLRRNREETKIIETELERVEKYTEKVGSEELPVLPRQTAIDLRYKLLRAHQALEHARLELEKHGFTAEEIESMEAGGSIPDVGEDTWRTALQRNGLWNAAAERLFDVVPADLRGERWTIATIGELAAGGLVSEELIAWLKDVQEGCEHFLEIGSLLQKGYSVEDIRSLHDLGALDAIVQVKAPAPGAVEDWDVIQIGVKPGDQVAAGESLLELLDPREMYLKTEPVGAEQAAILRAVGSGETCEARPLVEDSGPILREITLGFVSSDSDGRGAAAFAKVRNEELARLPARGDRRLRSWKLRAGLKYTLRVPAREIENAFVLPVTAVAADGPHRLVFLEDGESFEALPVAIAHEDERNVVLRVEDNPRLHPGDRLVTSGAYGLSLALESRSTAPGAHAGHQH